MLIISRKFWKVYFKLRKLLFLYLGNQYSDDDIMCAFQAATDYFYEILKKLDKQGEEKDEKI